MDTEVATEDRWECVAQWRAFQRVWAIFVALLVIVSWRLWIPQQVFPQVPMFAPLGHVPVLVDWVLLAALGVSLVAATMFVRPSWKRWTALAVFMAAMGGLILLDQHRLQAWAYQGLVIAMLLIGTGPQLGTTLLRVFAASVYFYSAAGKFDFQFLHTVGQQFLEATAGFAGVEVDQWELSTRVRVALALPFTELLLGLGALVPLTRRWAGWGLVVMHSVLLVLLGPLGLQHQPGVLAWNGFFIAQALILFVGIFPRRIDDRESLQPAPRTAGWWRSWGLPAVFVAVLALPLTERFGLWDHWPSWALYSPHSSRVDFSIHASRVDGLPESLQRHLEADRQQTGWHRLAIDRWSIDSLGVPVYPQARFQLGVVLAVLEETDVGEAVRLRLRGVADRWEGRREDQYFAGTQQLERAADSFWLNVQPRDRWNPRSGIEKRGQESPPASPPGNLER